LRSAAAFCRGGAAAPAVSVAAAAHLCRARQRQALCHRSQAGRGGCLAARCSGACCSRPLGVADKLEAASRLLLCAVQVMQRR